MNWESEVRVVKQSASSGLTMLVDLVAVFLPVPLLFLPVLPDVILLVWSAVLGGITAFLYFSNNQKNLLRLE